MYACNADNAHYICSLASMHISVAKVDCCMVA